MAFLEVNNIVKRFDNQHALNNVSVSVEKGELVCILGPSGCGKTTLLRTIAGLEQADSGQVFIDGRDATFLPAAKRNFGIVFQSYALFPNMTVMDNILFGLRQKMKAPMKEMKNRAQEVLEMVDLMGHCKKYPRQLSGGQQQRTALARAIAISPSFLLLDEPLSALDAKVRIKLRAEIRAIQKQLGVTTIMVTHDQEEALTMADRIVVMNNAVVEQTGSPKEIYNRPATHFVAGFIGAMNFMDNHEGTMAIRPEMIKIVTKQEPFDYIAHVTATEFKGPLTRVYGFLQQGQEVSIELASQDFDQLNINEGKPIFLRLPREYMARFQGMLGEAV